MDDHQPFDNRFSTQLVNTLNASKQKRYSHAPFNFRMRMLFLL